MKKSWFLVSMVAVTGLAVAQEGAAPQAEPHSEGVSAGKMLVAANGARVGAVYRVTDDGSAQLIVDGKLVTIPAATLSVVDGKLTTTLSKSDIRKLR